MYCHVLLLLLAFFLFPCFVAVHTLKSSSPWAEFLLHTLSFLDTLWPFLDRASSPRTGGWLDGFAFQPLALPSICELAISQRPHMQHLGMTRGSVSPRPWLGWGGQSMHVLFGVLLMVVSLGPYGLQSSVPTFNFMPPSLFFCLILLLLMTLGTHLLNNICSLSRTVLFLYSCDERNNCPPPSCPYPDLWNLSLCYRSEPYHCGKGTLIK